MSEIEKVVREVSDLRDFYEKIGKRKGEDLRGRKRKKSARLDVESAVKKK